MISEILEKSKKINIGDLDIQNKNISKSLS